MKTHNKNHIKAVERWTMINWGLSNKVISEIYGICYATVALNRKKYAPHTMKVRHAWRNKVLNLMVGNTKYIHTNNFVEHCACRVAGDKLGVKMRMQTVANGIRMRIG